MSRFLTGPSRMVSGVALIAILSCASLAHATDTESDVPRVALPDIVHSAEIIARIRVSASQPATWGYNQRGYSCGHLITATVVESLKGDVQQFKFLSPVEDLKPSDAEYLVFVGRRDISSVRKFLSTSADVLSVEAIEELNCRLSQELYVPEAPDQIVPFDKNAHAMFGGDWLAPVRSILWCEYRGSGSPGSPPFSRRTNKDDPRSDVINWLVAKRLIAQADSWPSRLASRLKRDRLGECE